MQNLIPYLAECLVEEAGTTSPPVDLFKIMDREKILSIGNDYGRAFDGRIEWNGKDFYLYYNTKYGDKDHPRVRFSIAHELGHYSLPAHRKILQTSPEGHPSNSHYIHEEGIEWEADAFAAYLLMPNFLFKPTLREIPDLGILT